MDSVTQIVLGAACGELVLGKKIGNRAMLWGAVAGTIPDLDILANLATDEIGALAYHRAITHSIFFAVFMAPVLGYLVHSVYERSPPSWSQRLRLWGLTSIPVFLLVTIGAWVLPITLSDALKIGGIMLLGIMIFPILATVKEKWRKSPLPFENPSWQSWSWLFFWSIFTHPLLDSCTAFGTQLFQPFSNLRIALNNISVADPIYTLPFLACILVASWLSRAHPFRRRLTWIGLGLSSLYLGWTFVNLNRVNNIVENSLSTQQIAYHRYQASPSIFNNILWQIVAEGDDQYYIGRYSLWDKEPTVNFTAVPKNHHLIAQYAQARDIEVLKWFTAGYYSILPLPDGTWQLNDMRYGSFNDEYENPDSYIFRFILHPSGKDIIAVGGERPNEREDMDTAFADLWERMKGI